MTLHRTLGIWGLFALGSRLGAANGQIFVANGNDGVGEYTISGVTVSRSLLQIPSGIGFPSSIALDGNGHLFVLTYGGVVGEYTTSGSAVNSQLITGLGDHTYGIALDGKGHVFISNYETGTIGEYTTTGETVNGSLISGLNGPVGMAVDSDGHLFVANIHNGIIGEYLTSGEVINETLIASGLSTPWAIALDGNGRLYVTDNGRGAVAVYKTSGEPINESLISGLAYTYGLALDGQGHLFVVNWGYNEIAEYTTEGTLLDSSLITGLDNPLALVVQSTNESVQILGPIVFEPQTGLFEQPVGVNVSGGSVAAVRLAVLGLPAGVTLYNASGSTNGAPFVEYDLGVGPGASVDFLLEYYTSNRLDFVSTNFSATAVVAATAASPTGTILQLDGAPFLSSGNVVIEFASVPGDTYVVQYSADMQTWETAVPPITAAGTRVQWIDAGPPKTSSPPGAPGQRFYRIVQLP